MVDKGRSLCYSGGRFFFCYDQVTGKSHHHENAKVARYPSRCLAAEPKFTAGEKHSSSRVFFFFLQTLRGLVRQFTLLSSSTHFEKPREQVTIVELVGVTIGVQHHWHESP